MAAPGGEDVEMADAAEGSGPSVFALLNPKREPAAAAPSKGKFVPKVKARPGARVRTRPSAQTEPKVETAPVPVNGESAIPMVVGDNAKTSSSMDTKGAGEIPLLTVKAEPDVVKSEPTDGVPLLNAKEEPCDEADLKLKLESDMSKQSIKEEVKEEPPSVKEVDDELKDEPMVVDSVVSKPGVDRVVREIDVFLTPRVDPETNLYVLQYPLRPYWRPYNLEERCLEVRIKPQQTKFEVDLDIDTTSENYDQDREQHLQIEKQTLASSKVAMTTSYAIGILRGNRLHLNPVQAVVQFRPSMKYIDEYDAAKKKSNKEAGIADGDEEELFDAEPPESKTELTLLQVNVRRRETERQEATRLQSHAYLKQLDEAEAWIPLEPHGTDSPITEGIRQKMVTSTQDRINFNLSPDAYLNTLVPGRASTSTAGSLIEDGSGNVGISRSHLETLVLPEVRFEYLLRVSRVQVLQFERLMKMAPAGCSDEELLNVLSNFAVLVQGCWVAASHIRPEYRGGLRAMRDYILFLFSKNRVVKHEQLRGLPLTKGALREIMVPIAVQRAGVGWEFQEDTDKSFIKKHQSVVKEQTAQWVNSEPGIVGALVEMNPSFPEVHGFEPSETFEGNSSLVSHSPKPPSGKIQGNKAGPLGEAGPSGDGHDKSNVENGAQGTMSDETRMALPGALKEIFAKHHVCTMQIIVQSLRDMAIERTVANSNPKSAAAAVAAAKAANAPASELTAAVCRVATNIGGVYFLTTLNNPALDPFREVVIALLRKMGPDAGLRKNDILLAFKSAGREAPSATYLKVMKELCYTRGAAWYLKPGDGRPA
uniref:DNA-directed RNA polymerase III subunit RPC5 n=1 Tax=Physcomitrium patens TaxID=3218 RepID=A0A7I4FJY4_PHYPA